MRKPILGKMKRAALWVFVVSSFSFHAVKAEPADYCSFVDHRPALGPVRDQSDAGWCFAYAAADLLTFETGLRASAADIAIGNEKSSRVIMGARKHFDLKVEVKSVSRVNKPGDMGSAVATFEIHRLLEERPVGVEGEFNYVMKDKPSFENAPHAYVLAGRARDKVTGKCRFLVRNSWGPGCDYYDKKVVQCAGEGHCWVNEEDLAANIESFIWVHP